MPESHLPEDWRETMQLGRPIPEGDSTFFVSAILSAGIWLICLKHQWHVPEDGLVTGEEECERCALPLKQMPDMSVTPSRVTPNHLVPKGPVVGTVLFDSMANPDEDMDMWAAYSNNPLWGELL